MSTSNNDINQCGGTTTPPHWLDAYIISINSLGQSGIDALFSRLTPQEASRAQAIIDPLSRNEAIASRGLLREMLSWYTGIPAESVVLKPGTFGKPYMESPIHFNIAHSHGLIAYAFSASYEVGIDVERIDGSLVTEELMKVAFAKDEIKEIRSLPSSMRTDAFFALWTRKEAFIKGTGEGFSADLHSFSITADPTKDPAFTRGGQGWHIHTMPAPKGFSAALSVHGENYSICIKEKLPKHLRQLLT